MDGPADPPAFGGAAGLDGPAAGVGAVGLAVGRARGVGALLAGGPFRVGEEGAGDEDVGELGVEFSADLAAWR